MSARFKRGETLAFNVEYSPFRVGYAVDLVLRRRHDGEAMSYATALTMQAIESEGSVKAARPEPLLNLEYDEAQNLMDELWRAGIRPTNGAGSTGQLAATERHLEDMRALTTRLMNVVAPASGEALLNPPSIFKEG